MESYQRRKDGSLFPVELSIGQFEFKGQTLYLGLARDITQRKEAEEEKAKLETQLLQSQKNGSHRHSGGRYCARF
jgi:two-component system sensor kinase FixL